MTLDQARELAFDRAGITVAERARILKKSFDRIDEGMDATKVELFRYKDGDIVESEPLVDHRIRLDAAQQGAEFFGPGKQSRTVSGGGKLEIEIKLPEWGRVIDVTPAESES